jgi:hypothetical protein
MWGGSGEGRGLAHGVAGSAWVAASGVGSVAPAGSVAGGLLILVACAGFVSALVTLASLLPFAAVGWLCLGVIAAGVLRAGRPTGLQALGRCPGQPRNSCCGE